MGTPITRRGICRRMVEIVGSIARAAGPAEVSKGRLAGRQGRLAHIALVVFALGSCTGHPGEDAEPRERVGRLTQALDTDADSLDDAWETSYFGNLSQTATGDYDSDGMTNGEEQTYGFDPTAQDGFADADGDKYPNVFEVRRSSNPTDASSTPSANYTVNAAGGGTHTTIGAAVTAATTANGQYQIIAIAAGTYTGTSNGNITIASTKPKLLFIGAGAAATIIDGGLSMWGWQIQNSAVIASLTVQKTWAAFNVDLSTAEVRFVDVLVRDNANAQGYPAGMGVTSGSRVFVTGSTFINNAGVSTSRHIYITTGVATITNTAVWGGGTGTMIAKATGATLTTNYSYAQNQTLTGTGNLAGSTDPKFRADLYHIPWDSPLRAAGGTVSQSRIDVDGELRPTTSPDIGVDQFLDSDSDDLADFWEIAEVSNLTTLTSRTQDADSDGLTNNEEYVASTKPTVADTDSDGLADGAEMNTHGTSPVLADTDGDDMPDGWEITYGISPTVANGMEDVDQDRYPNVWEYARSTNPTSASSVPTATYTVNAAGGGTHTNIAAAVTSATTANGMYQIIAIAPGTYTGTSNANVTIGATKPKILFIGQSAATTIIDGGLATWGWQIFKSAVIASLTVQKTWAAMNVDVGTTGEVRFVDMLIRDNANAQGYTAGIGVTSAAKMFITGSTFINNVGVSTWRQIYTGTSAATITNTVVYGGTGTMLAKATSGTLTTNHCLVQGQTLTGTGNLAGSTDPKFRADLYHLLWDSPLRAAGGTVAQSRIDIDGELRPTTSPDIGVDQFLDTDSDDLADSWELAEASNLTTLTSRTQDADSDGLTNNEEYVAFTKPTVADTDSDGLADGAEMTTHGTSPVLADTDGDDMPDGWEITYGISPTVANGLEDLDQDRYPNAWEYAHSTNPTSASSVPIATYTVNAAGGGTHTNIAAAVTSATTSNGMYQIIAIAPGTYTGTSNANVTIGATKPKILFIGQSAATTIIDGGLASWGWQIFKSAVIASITVRKTWAAMNVDVGTTGEVRFVDVLIRDNANAQGYTAGIGVTSAGKMFITGSTLVNNVGVSTWRQIYTGTSAATITNTVVYGGTGTMLAKASGGTLTTNYCLVQGQTLTGTGNLAGSTDPKFRSDLHHLRSDSPLRGAGGSVPASRVDVDGELRPTSAPDIGVDHFLDADSDGLPDAWEIATQGSTTAISGSGDEDNDGLNNTGEYNWETNRLDADTDNDLVNDGLEVSIGRNPLVVDADELSGDLNGDGIIDSIGVQLGYAPDQTDSDGDSVSNADEALMCTNPVRIDTDGDGVPDNTDAFPFDPLKSALPNDPADTTPPVITLTAPWYAVEQ